jgi:hypothetical protein
MANKSGEIGWKVDNQVKLQACLGDILLLSLTLKTGNP